MGGGNYYLAISATTAVGLSPRGRGKLGYIQVVGGFTGSIPAWAGETVVGDISVLAMGVYPRVGGGNHQRIRLGERICGLSPRGRGKPCAKWASGMA